MKKLILIFAFMFNVNLFAQNNDWDFDKYKYPKKPVKEFQFLAYYINQAVMNNVYAKNELLKGQTVGRLFGGNTTSTGQESFYFEQRLIPFMIYQPKLLNGKALLRMSFEIDWTWGDASYGTGGNFGSAISADQVNLQTQNIELELKPFSRFTINLGLQRLFDTPYNPYRTFFSTMTKSAYRLMYWGTDAVGISARYDWEFSRLKAGYYQLYENNPNQNDDVTLWEAQYEFDVTPNWRQGVAAYYVYDRANGEGGVSILGEGLNSNLANYNGVYRFPLEGKPYRADIFWLGTHWNYNAEFTDGRYSVNGFIMSNLGVVNTLSGSDYSKKADILGVAANMRLGYKYGATTFDNVEADFIFASGDGDDLSDGSYSGVITGNTWGSPASIFISSGAYLLYPHGNVVNRFISAISDLSNAGYGQIGAVINFSKSFIPNRLNGKIGVAAANSVVSPRAGGNFMGWEINGMLSFVPAVFMNVELHAAYLSFGNYYDSPEVNGNVNERPKNPYTLFAVFKWLMF